MSDEKLPVASRRDTARGLLTALGHRRGLVLLALVFLVTRLELWLEVARGIGDLGALGLALWGLVIVAVLSVVSFLAFRRAKP